MNMFSNMFKDCHALEKISLLGIASIQISKWDYELDEVKYIPIVAPNLALSNIKMPKVKVMCAIGYTLSPELYSETMAAEYIEYLNGQRKRILQIACDNDIDYVIRYYAASGTISGKIYDELIAYANKKRDTVLVAFLLEEKRKNVDIEKQLRSEELKAKREFKIVPERPKKVTAADLRKLWVIRENNDKTITICGYKGNDHECEIPGQIGTKIVTAISGTQILNEESLFSTHRVVGYQPFGRNTNITRIVVPASVKKFDEVAFWECENLTIVAAKNSPAEKFAIENEMKFEELPE
jgi:hypothetical protein